MRTLAEVFSRPAETIFRGMPYTCASDGSAVYCTWLDFFGTDGNGDAIDQQGDFIAVAGQAQFGGTTAPPSQGSLDAGSGHIYVAKPISSI